MERGLLWLPLLVMFIWLAWSGWNEYQKVEAYRLWAQQFDQAKYDIYAVLGQQGNALTWGKPARNHPVDLTSFSLKQVKSIYLRVNDQRVPLEPLPQGKKVAVEFQFYDDAASLQIPFTEISLAARWAKHLQTCLTSL
ncbi:MAG TPA: hypothetical protein V6D03_04685 [Candidatus Caenarcaniphilales bacterium]